MKYPNWVEDFLSKPLHIRQQIELCKTGIPKKYNHGHNKPTKWNKEQIKDFLKSNYILTCTKLRAINRTENYGPSMRQIENIFGTWTNCKNETYELKNIELDEKKILEFLVANKVLTSTQYLNFYKLNKTFLPSLKVLGKHFGRWSNIKRIIQGLLIESILERYIKLKIKIGGFPTKKECKANGIELEVLASFLSNTELIELVSKMEFHYENTKRNKK